MTDPAQTTVPEPAPRAPIPWFTLFLLVACVVLGAQVVLLSRQVRQLKSGEYPRPAPAALENEIKPGTRLDTLRIVDQSGATQTIFTGQRTLLLFTSPQCSFCEQAKPFWRELIAAAEKAGVKPYALVAGAPPSEATVAAAALPCPVFAYLSPAASPLKDMPITPAVALVNEKGEVVRTWGGLMSSDQQREALSALATAARAKEASPPRP
jgi:hypothetical protein